MKINWDRILCSLGFPVWRIDRVLEVTWTKRLIEERCICNGCEKRRQVWEKI